MTKLTIAVQVAVKEKNVEALSPPVNVEIDADQELINTIPDLQQKFKKLLKGDTDYYFRKVVPDKYGKPQFQNKLNVHLSLSEQGLLESKNKFSLVLYPLSLLMEKETQFSVGRGSVEGTLEKYSKKQKKKQTAIKRRWCVFKDGLLYYFEKKAGEVKPSGIIDVEYVSLEYDGALTIKMDHPETGTFSKKQSEYFFTTESAEEAKKWMKFLSKEALPGARTYTFGFPLSGLQKRADTVCMIPGVVIKTIEYIDEKALDLEGIFRVPGVTPDIEAFKTSCDAGQELNLEICNDPHTVAGLLKLYLRELPEPLLTFDHYEEFLESSKDLTKLIGLVGSLPKANQAILKFLLSFMKRVVDHKANQMDVQALATVFAPNILRPREETVNSLMGENAIVTNITMLLIENQSKFTFDVPEFVPPVKAAKPQPPSIQTPTTTPPVQNRAPVQPPVVSQRPPASTPPAFGAPPPSLSPPPSLGAPPSLSPPPSLGVPPQRSPPPSIPSSPAPQQQSFGKSYLKAKYPYQSRGNVNARGESELSCQKGDIMELVEKRNTWNLVNLNGSVGLVPANYVEPCDPPAHPIPSPVYSPPPPPVSHPPVSPQPPVSSPPPLHAPPPMAVPPPLHAPPPPMAVPPPLDLNTLPPPISVDDLPPPLDASQVGDLPPPLDASQLEDLPPPPDQ